MVELASKKFVCIIDESKLVEGLGGSKGMTRLLHASSDALPLHRECAGFSHMYAN